MKHTKVLIIGAGPTGLLAACQLRGMGIDCIIIDPKSGPTNESRAVAVQARTLELYEQMGIAAGAVANGGVAKGLRVINPTNEFSVQLSNVGKSLSAYPYVLIFEQSKNERLLYRYLQEKGGEVLWQHEAVRSEQDAHRVSVEVKDAAGNTETITADYLIAADGARSFVRHTLNLTFKGDTYEHIFYVVDTQVPDHGNTWSHDFVNLYASRSTFMALFPLQEPQRYRAVGTLPKEYQSEHPQSFEEIEPLIKSEVARPLSFEGTRWFSVYRVHHRCVDDFRVSRIFLCGDAAHIHSPAGGQGMNTGLQDAYNLCWKLAMVLQGKLGGNVLDSYQQERLPNARRLVKTTDRAFTGVTSPKALPVFLRTKVLPFLIPKLIRVAAFRRAAFRTVSQIAIRYPQSLLTKKSSLSKALTAGKRFPYIELENGNFYGEMKEMKFHLLIIAPDEALDKLRQSFGEAYAPFLNIIPVHDNAVRQKLGITSDALILVRPDHYIAFAGRLAAVDELRQYLTGLMP